MGEDTLSDDLLLGRVLTDFGQSTIIGKQEKCPTDHHEGLIHSANQDFCVSQKIYPIRLIGE